MALTLLLNIDDEKKYNLAFNHDLPHWCILDWMQVETGRLVDCVSQLSRLASASHT